NHLAIRRLEFLLQGLAHWNFRQLNGHSMTRQMDLAITRLSFLPFFSSLRSVLQLSVLALSSIQIPRNQGFYIIQQFKKDVSNSVAQESIMNAHNKTQLTQARINCALKGSSCASPLSKILKFTMFASNASSSSTKVLKCPHTKMIPHSHTMVQQFIVPESKTTLTLKKINTCMTSPIGLPLFSSQHLFQLTLRSKRFFKACNWAECK
ncbi:hypothetical protein H5410_057277, partial [Solanum commersonii]